MNLNLRRSVDPLTGEPITFSEKMSLVAQSILRRWSIVGIYLGLSLVWWIHPVWFGDDFSYIKWMVLFSLLAVVNESLIGIGMFSRSNRDSIVLRKVLRYLERGEEHDYEVTALQGRILNLEQTILSHELEIEDTIDTLEDGDKPSDGQVQISESN